MGPSAVRAAVDEIGEAHMPGDPGGWASLLYDTVPGVAGRGGMAALVGDAGLEAAREAIATAVEAGLSAPAVPGA